MATNSPKMAGARAGATPPPSSLWWFFFPFFSCEWTCSCSFMLLSECAARCIKRATVSPCCMALLAATPVRRRRIYSFVDFVKRVANKHPHPRFEILCMLQLLYLDTNVQHFLENRWTHSIMFGWKFPSFSDSQEETNKMTESASLSGSESKM